VALYFGLRKLLNLHAIMRESLGRTVFRGYLKAMLTVAWRFTRGIGNGSLQRYLLLMVATTLVLAGWPFVFGPWESSGAAATSQPMHWLGWMLWLVLVAGTLGTVLLHRQRLIALVVIGVVGLAVSLVFVLLSAPDLALTQLLVEMVTIALMLLALNYLPQHSVPGRSRLRRWRDAAIALAAGGGVAALVYAMITRPADTIATELLARSLPEGYGSNVVNVILVDFRGFDTLGEIAVFGIAGLVVHALLRRTRMAPDLIVPGTPDPLTMPAVLSHLLFPLALAVSAYLFLRGHNQPGGGFIAGLVLALPLLLQYVIQGSQYVESRLGFDYARCIGIGLLFALATGFAAMVWGYPFLTSGHVEPELPLIGKVPLASALGFDLGVYLVVFGGAMLILSMMGTIRRRRQTPALPETRP
jgi:multicomponent K+:H+ antiporter subunit A